MFTNEALRVVEHLAVSYDQWRQNERGRRATGPTLTWKHISGSDYLYEVVPGGRTSKSRGPRSPETEDAYSRFTQARSELDARTKPLASRIAELARLYRALRLPMIDAAAGDLLREADLRGMLGSQLLVAGTLTMAAYQIEAQDRIADGYDATDDIDLTLAGDLTAGATSASRFPTPLTDLIKAVDSTYTVNTERSFQARNSRAYEVEFLTAPEFAEWVPGSEGVRPLVLQSQGWLLGGVRVDQVVMDRSGKPARIVAPDPRLMGLHKLWLSEQPDRNPRKATKDKVQGQALLAACGSLIPSHEIDASFLRSIPDELHEVWDTHMQAGHDQRQLEPDDDGPR